MKIRALVLVGVLAAGVGTAVAVTAGAADNAGEIVGPRHKCVDVDTTRTANGTAVQLYSCNGTTAQRWTIATDSSIRALGKCLDANGASTPTGVQVQLWDCNNANAQLWRRSSGGSLVNVGTNQCLTIPGDATANRTRLEIQTCRGKTGQRWRLPSGARPAPTPSPRPSPTVQPTPSPSPTGQPTPTPTPTPTQTPAPTGAPTTTPAPTSMPPTGGPAPAAGQQAAPYFYLGWGNPPDPTAVMSATGVRWFSMAFILSNGDCSASWDGLRPLAGGVDQQAIEAIRAAGGDVIPSFGGAGGAKPKLEAICGDAASLAGAYQQVIDAYKVKAIDIDIETDAIADATVRQRTVDALTLVKDKNPGLTVYVTLPSGSPDGPDNGLIGPAAAAGLDVVWSIMPFDFSDGSQDMGTLTVRATEGLKNRLVAAYGYSADEAYKHAGISTMNGITDVNETVTLDNYKAILAYAQQHHIARLTFWSVNRDRPCDGSTGDSCSGINQAALDFTKVTAQYRG